MQIVRTRLGTRAIDWRRLAALLLSVLALIIGVLAWTGYTYASRTEPLVIATQPIAPGTRITADMLQVIQAPLTRADQLRGLSDTRMISGTYALVQFSPNQIIQADTIQVTPLNEHVYEPADGPPEVLHGTVFELSVRGITTVHAQDRINIIALIDAKRGVDPAFSIGTMDVGGAGPRAVRVMRNVNVLDVTTEAVLIEVTNIQSQYLWSLASADVPFVGEIVTSTDAPLGPLRPEDIDLPRLDDQPSDPSGLLPPINLVLPAETAPVSPSVDLRGPAQ